MRFCDGRVEGCTFKVYFGFLSYIETEADGAVIFFLCAGRVGSVSAVWCGCHSQSAWVRTGAGGSHDSCGPPGSGHAGGPVTLWGCITQQPSDTTLCNEHTEDCRRHIS